MVLAPFLGFDPLEIVSELFVIAAVAAALALAWANRGRVIMAITGDDRIHGTSLDLVEFACFRCCGLCTGDWSRILSMAPCCPRRLRGANLVKIAGQLFGATTYTVELKNIVVGDLPFDGPGDFFLEVECAANPPMMTSLAETKYPKVVHFPEVLTLRLRWSHLEQRVRISVKELDVLGSKELCQCHISATSILHWSNNPNEKMKRFELTPLNVGIERETQAWILVEFDQPSEARDLEHFHGNISTVRTATRDGHYKDTSLGKFKREYVLLDSSGHVMHEPLEEQLQDLARIRACANFSQCCCGGLALVCCCLWLGIHSYSRACQRQYHWLALASARGMAFPPLPRDLGLLRQRCADPEATGTLGAACRQNATAASELCVGWNETLRRPRAFQQLGGYIQEGLGVPCGSFACKVHKHLHAAGRWPGWACAALVLLSCLCRPCASGLVRQRRRQQQQERLQEQSQLHERMEESRQRSVLSWR